MSVRVFASGPAMHVVAGIGVAAILSDAAARTADADLLWHETASHKDQAEGKHRGQAHLPIVTTLAPIPHGAAASVHFSF